MDIGHRDPLAFRRIAFLPIISTLQRHEIARVSELLQSQLLQPLKITPLQPNSRLRTSRFCRRRPI